MQTARLCRFFLDFFFALNSEYNRHFYAKSAKKPTTEKQFDENTSASTLEWCFFALILSGIDTIFYRFSFCSSFGNSFVDFCVLISMFCFFIVHCLCAPKQLHYFSLLNRLISVIQRMPLNLHDGHAAPFNLINSKRNECNPCRKKVIYSEIKSTETEREREEADKERKRERETTQNNSTPE